MSGTNNIPSSNTTTAVYADKLQSKFRRTFHKVIVKPSHNLHKTELVQGYYRRISKLFKSAQQKAIDVVVFDIHHNSENFRDLLAFEKHLSDVFGMQEKPGAKKVVGTFHQSGDIHSFTFVAPKALVEQFANEAPSHS